MSKDVAIPEDAQLVGTVGVQCPSCDTEVPISVHAWITGEPGEQRLQTESDMSDLWAHMWTHPSEESPHV